MPAKKVIIEIPMDMHLLCVTRGGVKLILEKIAEFCPENLARVEQRPWEPAKE